MVTTHSQVAVGGKFPSQYWQNFPQLQSHLQDSVYHRPFRTAAVLGAGVMGAQIAAHLANAGLMVHLLDLAAKEGDKNALVEGAFKKAVKLNPPPLFTEKTARRITLGNFDDHFHRVREVDWVIEVVVENLEIKQQLMARLEKLVRPDAVVSTNTSGLPIQDIAKGLSLDFRGRFLGTHFFNPPRYLKLLELIPTPDTDSQIVERLKWFGRLHLGKGVVIAKDTPNFIANRIGIYATMLGIRAFTEEEYSIEEVDILTGTLVGRPKSGTFRTADLVGLDTLVYVAKNLYPAIPHDESREMFKVPELLETMLSKEMLGAKVKQGFYKKEKGKILSLNPKTWQYEEAKNLELGEADRIGKLDLSSRLRTLYEEKGRAGELFRKMTLEILGYSARRIPEIADSPLDIDQAMKWGFAWEIGPFAMWDMLGFETVLKDMKALEISVPEWVMKMHSDGMTSFYQDHQVYTPTQQYVPVVIPKDEMSLVCVKDNPNYTLWKNEEAALLDIGDGVVLYDFRSKANTLSIKVIEGLFEVLELLENSDFRGMVIGNDGAHFSVGANLAEMGKIKLAEMNPLSRIKKHFHGPPAHPEAETGIPHLIHQFQRAMQRIHYCEKPVVAAIQGRVLGGGCELVMACPQVVASAETYIGLVELGAGLIPAGTGLMRMAAWAAEKAVNESPGMIQPFLQKAFETIAMAKVANSAYEGKEMGFISSHGKIVMNSDRRLSVAKQEVLRLSLEGYTPMSKRDSIMVLGRPTQALFKQLAYTFRQGEFISEYDEFLVNQLAYVITGGDLTAPTLVSEDYLLELERNTFLSLLDEKKTQARIMHLLKTKKPLRN